VRSHRGVVKEVFIIGELGGENPLPEELPDHDGIMKRVFCYSELFGQVHYKVEKMLSKTPEPTPKPIVPIPSRNAFPAREDIEENAPVLNHFEDSAGIILAQLFKRLHQLDRNDIDAQMKALMSSLASAIEEHNDQVAAEYALMIKFYSKEAVGSSKLPKDEEVVDLKKLNEETIVTYNYLYEMSNGAGDMHLSYQAWLDYGVAYPYLWECAEDVTVEGFLEQFKEVENKLAMSAITNDQEHHQAVCLAACMRLAIFNMLGSVSAQNNHPMLKHSNLLPEVRDRADALGAVHDFVNYQLEQLEDIGSAPLMRVEGMQYEQTVEVVEKEDAHALVNVEDRYSDAGRTYAGAKARFCRIDSVVIQGVDETSVDNSLISSAIPHGVVGSKPDGGPELKFKISGHPFRLSLKLKAKLQDSEGTMREPELEFFPQGTFDKLGTQCRDLTYKKIMNPADPAEDPQPEIDHGDADLVAPEDNEDKDQRFFQDEEEITSVGDQEVQVSFKTQGGITAFMDKVDKYDSASCALLSIFSALDLDEPNGTPKSQTQEMIVTLTVKTGSSDFDGAFFYAGLDRFTSSHASRQQRFMHPYRYAKGKQGPAIQNGNLLARTVVQEARGGTFFKHPAVIAPADMKEYAIYQNYAAFYNHKRDEERCEALQKVIHCAKFVKLSNHGPFLVGLKLSPTTSTHEYQPSVGSKVVISWLREGASTDRETCICDVIDNIFGFPIEYTPLLVRTDSLEVVQKLPECQSVVPADEVDSETHAVSSRDVSVQISINAAVRDRTMAAVKSILEDPEHRFHQALLGRKSAFLQSINPVTAKNHRQALKLVLDMPSSRIQWNNEQKDYIRAHASIPGGILILKGVPGCGKTLLEVALAVYYQKCGVAFLATSPTNEACDAFVEAIQDWNAATTGALRINDNYIRVYAMPKESQAFKSNATGKRVELASQAAISAAAQDTTVSVPPMLQACLGLQQKQQTRRYKLAKHSLENAVVKVTQLSDKERPKVPHLATSEKIEVLFTVLKMEKPEGYQQPAVNNHEDPEDQQKWEVDVWEVVTKLIPVLQANPDTSQESAFWGGKDDQVFRKLRICLEFFSLACNDIIGRTGLVIVTDASAGDGPVRSDFGRDFEGIYVHHDETFMGTEGVALIPLGRLEHRQKIKAIGLTGDDKQAGCNVIANKEFPAQVEFSEQMAMPLATRLIACKTPQVVIQEQNRMHPDLSSWPAMNIYEGRMKDGPTAMKQEINSGTVAALRLLTGDYDETNPMRLNIISHDFSFAYKPGSSTSRVNKVHIELALAFYCLNMKFQGYKGEDMAFVTGYNATKTEIQQALAKLANSSTLPLEWHPKLIVSADGSQGHQAKMVWVDPVVSEANQPSDLGHIKDLGRFNTMITRPKECMVILLPKKLMTGKLYMNNMDHFKKPASTQRRKLAPLAYLSDHAPFNKIHELNAPVARIKNFSKSQH
jgi:hypothetical protein